MTNMNVLGAIILFFIVFGSVGWLLQEVPGLLKKKFFNRVIKKNNQPTIKVGMYYKL